MTDALTSALVAIAATGVLSPIVIAVLRRFSVVDRALDRSSHEGVVLRGGGLAVLLGGAVAIAVGLRLNEGAEDTLLVSIAGVLLFSALGFADDLRTLPALVRLVIQVLLASAVGGSLIAAGVHPAVGLAGVVWLIVFVNAFNFMDGINGISGVAGALIGLALAFTAHRSGVDDVAIAAAAVGGASLGFLPSNFPNARVFLGDVGSYAIGAALASLSIVLIDAGAAAVPTLLPFSLYLGDVFFTLARRQRAGANILKSHREHVYQRLANGGLGHVKTTGLVAGLMSILVALSQAAVDQTARLQTAIVLAAACLVAGYLASPKWFATTVLDTDCEEDSLPSAAARTDFGQAAGG